MGLALGTLSAIIKANLRHPFPPQPHAFTLLLGGILLAFQPALLSAMSNRRPMPVNNSSTSAISELKGMAHFPIV